MFTTFLFERANQFSAFYPGDRPTANAPHNRLAKAAQRSGAAFASPS
jgi:hypothetical protein